MKRVAGILTIIAFGIAVSYAQESAWTFEMNSGVPINVPSRLSILQENEVAIRFKAVYRSEPFRSPFFYDIKIGRSVKDTKWEIELIHHKLFLDNPPEEVEYFSITHGYNMLTLNRIIGSDLLNKLSLELGIGAGIVLAHPENMIRDKKLAQSGGFLNLGYYITGPVMLLSASRHTCFYKSFYLIAGIKACASFSIVPIEGGSAKLWSFPFIVAFGIGADIHGRDMEIHKTIK